MRALGLLAFAACTTPAPDMPWLHGLDNVFSSKGTDIARSPEGDLDEGCGVAASRPIELFVDIDPSPGTETVFATYSGGITIFDRNDKILAETRGYRCDGSADELDAIAVGTANGERVLAIAATSGGRRETTTWIGLFRIAPRAIEPTFAATVETNEDDITARGDVVLFPGGIVHRSPAGPTSLWRLDPGARVYVPVLGELPHDEPDAGPAVSMR